MKWMRGGWERERKKRELHYIEASDERDRERISAWHSSGFLTLKRDSSAWRRLPLQKPARSQILAKTKWNETESWLSGGMRNTHCQRRVSSPPLLFSSPAFSSFLKGLARYTGLTGYGQPCYDLQNESRRTAHLQKREIQQELQKVQKARDIEHRAQTDEGRGENYARYF